MSSSTIRRSGFLIAYNRIVQDDSIKILTKRDLVWLESNDLFPALLLIEVFPDSALQLEAGGCGANVFLQTINLFLEPFYVLLLLPQRRVCLP